MQDRRILIGAQTFVLQNYLSKEPEYFASHHLAREIIHAVRLTQLLRGHVFARASSEITGPDTERDIAYEEPRCTGVTWSN